MKRRFGRGDWLALGLKALGEGGPEALTIEALCARAGRTRGSFYHHFETIDAYLAALAGHWSEQYTEEVIRRAETRSNASRKLDHLNTLAVDLDARVEQGMRRLAASDEHVRAMCRTVDARRISYLAGLYEQTGRYTAEEAEALARIEYAAFIGFQVIAPDTPRAELRATYDALLRLTGRHARGKQAAD